MEKSIYTEEYGVLVDILRQARAQAGLTQVELAEQLGQTQSFVTKYERGERRLDIVQLRRICHALGTSLPGLVRTFERRLAETEDE